MCGFEKLNGEFNFKYKSRDIRQKHCRSCSRAEIKRHYLANRQYYLDKARKRNLKYREMVNNYIFEYLTRHSCVDCGERDPVVLEFDHVRDKYKAVSQMRVTNSFKKIISEIAKCEVRCANCHRRKTLAKWSVKISKQPL
jgi:hypothetical protein